MNNILQKLEKQRGDNYITSLLNTGFTYYPIETVKYLPKGQPNKCEQNALDCVLLQPKLLSFEEWELENLEMFHGRKSWLSNMVVNQTNYQNYVDKFKRKYDLMYGYMVYSSADLVHHWAVFDNEGNQLVEVTPLKRDFLGYLMKKMGITSWEKAKNYWDVKEGKFGF